LRRICKWRVSANEYAISARGFNSTAANKLLVLVPWPCAHECIAIVTHPRIYKTPTPLERALEALAELNACPTLEFIGEADGYLDSLSGIALAARVQAERSMTRELQRFAAFTEFVSCGPSTGTFHDLRW
jgi:hypothetical protein